MPKSIFFVEYLSLMSPEVFREKLTDTHTIDKTGTWKGEWIDDKRFRIEISGIEHEEVTIDKLVIRGKVVSDESSEMIDKRIFRMYLWTRTLPSFTDYTAFAPMFFPVFSVIIITFLLSLIGNINSIINSFKILVISFLLLNLYNIIIQLVFMQVKHKTHLIIQKIYCMVF